MTNQSELDEVPPRFNLYLRARAMRDDDRTMSYIAKKLGFNNASSVASLLNRYDWLYHWHNKQVVKTLERLYPDNNCDISVTDDGDIASDGTIDDLIKQLKESKE